MGVTQVILSGITLLLHVDQFAASTLALADSHMMMQLCRHYWEVKNLQQCALVLSPPTISYLAGQHTVKLCLRRITCAADETPQCNSEGSGSPCTQWWENLAALPGLRKVET